MSNTGWIFNTVIRLTTEGTLYTGTAELDEVTTSTIRMNDFIVNAKQFIEDSNLLVPMRHTSTGSIIVANEFNEVTLVTDTSPVSLNPIPIIAPGAAFNGTPSSGYEGSPPTMTGSFVPVLPGYGHMGAVGGINNSTRAPAAHVVWTSDFLPDGPLPANNLLMIDAHSIDDNAIVTFHFEGNTVMVPPSRRVLADVPQRVSASSTIMVKKPVYAVRVDRTNIPLGASVDWYATISSPSAGYQSRIIGPFRNFNLSQPNRTIVAGPGQQTVAGVSYPTIQEAVAAMATTSTPYINEPWIRIVPISGGVTMNVETTPFGASALNTNTRRGIIEIDGTANPVTVRRTNKAIFRPSVNGLVWRNCSIDMSKIDVLYTEQGTGNSSNYRLNWFIGCTIFSTGIGEEYGNGTTRATSITRWGSGMIACHIRDIQVGDSTCAYRHGILYERCAGDLGFFTGYTSTTAEGGPSYQQHCIAKDCNPTSQRTGIDAVEIAYTGTGTATITPSGSHNTNARTWTAQVNGSTVGTFVASVVNATVNSAGYTAGVSSFITTVGSQNSGSIAIGDKFILPGDPTVYTATSAIATTSVASTLNFTPALQVAIPAGQTRAFTTNLYTISDFVAAFNTALGGSGWSATTLNNSRRFASLGAETGSTPITITNTPTIITSHLWIHMDAFQLAANTQHDNSLWGNNLYLNCEVQIFPSVQQTSVMAINVFMWNSGSIAVPGGTDLEFQISGRFVASRYHHNSQPMQNIYPRYDIPVGSGGATDVFISNNICDTMIQAGTNANLITFVNNHVLGTNSITGTIGTVDSGTLATEFPTLTSTGTRTQADLIPAINGFIRNNLKAPTYPWDMNGKPRGLVNLVGAIAIDT